MISKNNVLRCLSEADKLCCLRSEFNPVVDNTVYELPDRKSILIGRESFEYPEIIFGCQSVTSLVYRNSKYAFFCDSKPPFCIKKRHSLINYCYRRDDKYKNVF